LNNKLDESFGGASYSELWEPLKGSFNNVLKAISLAAKDVWGSLAYALKLTFTFDKAKIREIKTNRQQTLNNISGEYEKLWAGVVASNPDMSTLAMIAAPGPYFAAYIALNGRRTALGMQNFFKDAGVDSSLFDKFFGLGGGEEPKRNWDNLGSQILRRDGSGSQKAELQRKLDSVISKLENIFQMQTSQKEGVELIRSMLLEKETGSSAPLDIIANGVIGAANSEEFKKFMNAKVDINKIISEKNKQLEAYEKVLNAPVEFYKAVRQSKGIEEIFEAYKLLDNSFLKIEGFDFKNPQKQLGEIANKTYEKIKNDEKTSKDILKAAGVNIDISSLKENEKKNVLLSALTKLQSIKELQNIQEHVSSPEFEKVLSEAKIELLESFLDGISEKELEKMKSVDNSNPYVKLLLTGIDRIKKAGLQK
jgi:hypothetical protein